MAARFCPVVLALVSILVIVQGISGIQEIIVAQDKGIINAFEVDKTSGDNFKLGSNGVFFSDNNIKDLIWNPVAKVYLAVNSDMRSVSEISIWNNEKTFSFMRKPTPIKLSIGISQLSVDYLRGNVYWTDPGLQMIMMKSLLHDGTDYSKTVLEGIDGLSGIVCYPEQEKLFWIQNYYTQRIIMTADLNGENISIFIDYGLVNPLDLDVDMDAEKLYWIDSVRNTLNYVNLYGDYDRGIIPTGKFGSLSGLAVLSMGRIVVYNSREVRIVSYEDEVAKSQLVVCLNHTITALTVRPDRNTTLSVECVDLRCEQFCIVKNSFTKCGCKQGYLLSTMGDHCLDDHDYLHNVLFLLIDQRVCYVSTGYIIGEHIEPTCISTFENVVDIAADVNRRKLFLLIAESHSKIIDYNVNRKQITTVFDTTVEKEIYALTFDGMDRYLYWAHAGKLYRFSVEDKKTAIIMHNIRRISDLETSATEKRLFWINADDHTIETSSFNGHNRKMLVTAVDAYQLVFSEQNERLYWTTGQSIVSVNIEGADIQISQKLSRRVAMIGIFKGIIFWFSETSRAFSFELNYCSLDNTENIFQSSQINGTIGGVALFDDSRQDSRADIRQSLTHHCSGNTGIDRCKCPLGLRSDMERYSCYAETLQDNFFIFLDPFSSFAYQVDMDTQNVSIIPTKSPVLYLKLDPDSQSIVLTCQNRSIEVFSIINESTDIYYFANLRPTHAIIDRSVNHILFVADNSSSANLYRIDQRREIMIQEKYEDVIDIALHSKKRFFYASVGGTNSLIRMLKLENNEETVLSFPLQIKPGGMALDEKGDHLYFIDSAKEYILRTGLNGDLLTFFYEDKGAIAIDVAGEFIYSLSINRRWIAKMDKKGQSADEIKFPLIIGNAHAFGVFIHGNFTVNPETHILNQCSTNELKENFLRKVVLGLGVGFSLLVIIIIAACASIIVRIKRYSGNEPKTQDLAVERPMREEETELVPDRVNRNTKVPATNRRQQLGHW